MTTPRSRARRVLLGLGTMALVRAATATAAPLPCVDTLRARVEGIDLLLARARSRFEAGAIERGAYRAILELLHDEEAAIHATAAARVYDDIGESNYWHRGRLKFPTVTQQELARLASMPPR